MSTVWHWSVWGFQTACGRHLSSARRLTRSTDIVTCKTCRKVVGS